ncbi:MAG: hypothetical protein HND56_10505 [Pseudomonadota bacterium]|nr:MAG: hypothetical protein HND56_10505 [Pseudomonadota bacterium]
MTQIAAFVVLVAVPVGAALYCAYAFFQKRHQMAWGKKDVYILGVMLTVAVLYTACLGREHLRALFFPLLYSSALYLIIRIVAMWRDIGKGRPVVATELYGETAIIYVSLLVILGFISDVFEAIPLLFSKLLLEPPSLLHVTALLVAFIPFAFLAYRSWKKSDLIIRLVIVSAPLIIVLIFSDEVLAILVLVLLLLLGPPVYWLRIFIKGKSCTEQRQRFPIVFYLLGLICVGIFCSLTPLIATPINLAIPIHRITIAWFVAFVTCFFVPIGLVLWFGRVYFKHGFMTRQSVGVYFLAACYVLAITSKVTVQSNYYPMFVKNYGCAKYERSGSYTIPTRRPMYVPPPNVFEKIFVKIPRHGGLEICYCPEGRDSLKLYEKSLCLPEPRKPSKQEEKTE